jgi:protein tyrosine phosphatase
MHENNNVGFSDEFKRIYRNEIRLPANAFKANKKVNRYKNIPTYDHSRVVLPTVSGFRSDYITSAYIDGYYRPKKYIAAQGPLTSTCTDFWRMIWAEDVPTIVMLTHLREGVKIKCHQYWPDSDANKSTFGPFVVTIRKIDVYADYIVRTLNVILEEKKRTVYQYHFTAWPDHDVPKFATALLGFIGRVNRDHARDRGPIVVHCSAGAGRTGTYIVIDTMMDRAEDSQPIDIYSCVTYLRTRRAQMVQTEAQYMFIHDAVLESVICGDTKIPVHDISRAIAKMSKKDPRSKMTGFQLHFKVLQASGPHPDSKSCKAGLRPQVQTKNRYKDVVPFDRSRVLLKTGEDSTDEYVNTTAGAEYINASFVDGYRRRGAFIVTQAPLKATVNDFWKMIWEQDCYSIVMLTPLEEEEKEMCHRYWPTSEKQQYGSITVEVNEETDSGDYVIRQMTVTESQATRVVTQFHYTNWLEYGSPDTPSDILDMINQLQKWQQATGDEVITIHCNDGVGRSGAFCGLFTLIETTNMESVIDFFHKVKAMRIQRPGMVQTVDQYMFMHEVILAYLDSFQTYSNFK